MLLVEDDADLRILLKELLESEGYQVIPATDGADALDKLNAAPKLPRLIILDWMMPKMDGARFCLEKKNLPDIDGIPVILLTANGQVDQKTHQVGASLGIAKPVDVETLLSAVREKLAPP